MRDSQLHTDLVMSKVAIVLKRRVRFGAEVIYFDHGFWQHFIIEVFKHACDTR